MTMTTTDPISLALFAEFGPRVHTFAWQSAQTRRGTVKAVGTAEDQGKTLYGKKAQAALAQKGGGRQPAGGGGLPSLDGPRPTPTRPQKELTDVTKVRGVRPAAAGPDPAAQAAYDADGPMRKLAARVKAGNPEAAQQVRAHAAAALPKLAESAPPATPEAHAAVRAAAAAATAVAGGANLVTRAARAAGGLVRNFLSGLAGGDRAGLAARAGRLGRSLARLGGRALWWGVRHLAKFAWGATKAVARGARDVATSDTVRPFLHWAGFAAAAAACLASPFLALHVGLGAKVAWLAAMAAPVGVFLAGRFKGRMATDAALKAKGEGFLTKAPTIGIFAD